MPAVSIKRMRRPRLSKVRIDRVAGGPGDRRNDGAFFPQQRVEQRTLSDVGAAHDRQRQFAVGCGGGLLGRQLVDDRVEQVARAFAVDRRDRDRFSIAQPRELAGDLRQRARAIRLCSRR